MKRLPQPWFPIVLACASIILFGSTTLAQQKESIGKVTALQGKATVLHKGSAKSEPLMTQSPLYQEDTIETDVASKIKITFVDGTVLSLGEKGVLEITKFVYSPQRKTQISRLTIAVGLFRAVVEKLLPVAKFEVATTTTVAAIRGTDWMGEVKPDSTAMVVLKGKVAIANFYSDTRGHVTLTEGMGTTVNANQPPTTPNKWGEARINALMKATALP